MALVPAEASHGGDTGAIEAVDDGVSDTPSTASSLQLKALHADDGELVQLFNSLDTDVVPSPEGAALQFARRFGYFGACEDGVKPLSGGPSYAKGQGAAAALPKPVPIASSGIRVAVIPVRGPARCVAATVPPAADGADIVVAFWAEVTWWKDTRLRHRRQTERLRLRKPTGSHEPVSSAEDTIRALLALPEDVLVFGTECGDLHIAEGCFPSDKWRAHDEAVNALAALPATDGRFASGSEDSTIKLWAGNLLTATLEGHTAAVTGLCCTASGSLVSASMDHTLKVWDTAGDVCLVTMVGHTDVVWDVDEVAPGIVASASGDTTIRLWKVVTGELAETLTSHTQAVTAVRALPGGDGVPLFASASQDSTLKVWKKGGVKDGWFLTHMRGIDGRVNALDVLADGVIVAATSANQIQLWKV